MKLSIAHMGQSRPHSEETKTKIRNSQQNSKPIIQLLENVEVARYSSISEAARTLGDKKCIKENIRQCCHGQRKSAYGYTWIFENEDND